MRKTVHCLKWSTLFLVAMSLTACSGSGESKKTVDSTASTPETEVVSERMESEGFGTEAETEAETEAGTEAETEAGTEAETETKETETVYEEVGTVIDLPVFTSGDSWSVPEVTVKDVPDDLLTAALGGNKAIYTYLSDQEINYDYYSGEYYAGYGFLSSPAQLLGYDVYGAVRYDKDVNYSADADMLFLILPKDDEEYADMLEDLKKDLEKQSSYDCARMIAAPDTEEERDVVYAVQEYMIDGNACYLMEGYKNNDILFGFNQLGFDGDFRVDNVRYQGECEKCIVLASREGLSHLSDYSTVYDLDRSVRYNDSYQELIEEESNSSLSIYTDSDYEIDDYPGYTYSSSDYCYHAYDSLEYKLITAETEKGLNMLRRTLETDTQGLIRLAGRLGQLDGYKDAYYRLLNIAAVLIRRGETDAASEIVSYLEDQWEEEDKTERLAAFGDTEYDRRTHYESYLAYLKEILDNDEECDYLNTVWQVRISAPYQFGERDVSYDSDQYKKEYQPLIDQLVELKGYRNAPLYLQKILKPFLEQTIEKRNTDAADQIIAMMEEYFPECGEYEITENELEDYHTRIDTIKEEEAYKAEKREELNKAKEGDVFSFGTKDEKALEWIILEKQEDKVLLLLQEGFGMNRFGKQQEKARYTESDISSMLEREIFGKVFSNAEKQMALPFSLKKDGSYSFGEGNNHFHLPGTKEAKKFLPEKKDRILYDEAGTPQAWWLRTAGDRKGFVRYIDTDGSIIKGGTPSVKELEVRPLIWIDCSED